MLYTIQCDSSRQLLTVDRVVSELQPVLECLGCAGIQAGSPVHPSYVEVHRARVCENARVVIVTLAVALGRQILGWSTIRELHTGCLTSDPQAGAAIYGWVRVDVVSRELAVAVEVRFMPTEHTEVMVNVVVAGAIVIIKAAT